MAIALALTGALLAACAPAPPDDPFFETSNTSADKAPLSRPGDLIRYRPSIFTVDPIRLAEVSRVNSYQVMYTSTSALGAFNVVSGTVLVPEEEWTGPGTRPLVTVGVGTRGLGDECAPSYAMTTGLDYEGGEYVQMLRKGWAVAVSDMVGLGTPGLHTYEVGREQGTALLDIARAAQKLPEAGLDPTGPVGIMGYSQGGTSAGWAAQLAATYAPELNVKGTAAGGVASDLLAVARALDGKAFVGLALMAAVGFDAAYPELDLDGFLNDRGRKKLEHLNSLCVVSLDGLRQLIDVADTRFSHYMADEDVTPLTDQRWVTRMEENRLGKTAPSAPVLQQHALFDQMVAFPQAAELMNEWCEAGANVTWRVHVLAEHVIGGFQSIQPAIDFLSARFAGRPVKGTCPG